MRNGTALIRLRAEHASMRLDVALLKLRRALKYNPDQPRAPAGSPDGGRWVGDGGGSGGAGGGLGRRPAGAGSQPVRIAQYERGTLISRYGAIGGRNWCVYRFSFGDITVPGPTNRDCLAWQFSSGVVHGQILNDNRPR